MDKSIQKACLFEIQRLWLGAEEPMRPNTAWIAEHQPVPPDTNNATTPVVKSWLLSERGIEQRTAADYVRLITVHSGTHWASGNVQPPSTGVFGRVHSIGLAAFAHIENSDRIYLDFAWGGLFGRGAEYRFDLQTKAVELVRDFWVS